MATSTLILPVRREEESFHALRVRNPLRGFAKMEMLASICEREAEESLKWQMDQNFLQFDDG